MKKIISVSLALTLCLAMLLTAVSCSSKHPLEAFKDKMEREANYQMSMTMSNVPLLGTFTMTVKVDGNIQHVPASMLGEEEYIETAEDVAYSYTKNTSGKWTKAEINIEDASSDVMSDDNLFDPENYEKIEGKENTYKQKKSATFESFEDVTVTVEEDSCTFEMVSTDEGYSVKIVISKIGEIELTLPKIN